MFGCRSRIVAGGGKATTATFQSPPPMPRILLFNQSASSHCVHMFKFYTHAN